MVSLDGTSYTLPGGGAHRDESRREAAIRELMEETCMKAVTLIQLFEFLGGVHKGPRGGTFRNAHKVFRVTAMGTPKPGQEVKRVAYYDGSGPSLTPSAEKIIEKYLSAKSTRRS